MAIAWMMQTDSLFLPAWWLNNPHLQTLYPALLRKSAPPQLVRERLATPDGDFIDIDWCGEGGRHLVILLHGLSGSTRSGYIKGLQNVLLAWGFSSVAMNFRGCSGEPNRLARSYHSGDTEDIHFLYQTLRQRLPRTALSAVGFSLGGNVLLKWLGEQGDKLALFAAVAVSVPLVLSVCATKMDNGFSTVYRDRLLRELKHYVRTKHSHLVHLELFEEADKLGSLGDLSKIKSFWQYDDRVVAPLHDFKGVEDYYRRASSRQFLKNIFVPTLLIQADDDPFMTNAVLPTKEELSTQVRLEIVKGGGHVGFISGRNPIKPRYWLDQRIPAFLKSLADSAQ
jgi:uncharacterized protein